MGDHQDGAVGGSLLDQQLEYLRARSEVELTGRLVGQQDGVPGGQRPGYRDALLLSARQFVREVTDTVV